ncbi:MAG TPA: phosphoserine phosphatase SerB [Alphaproteobacteria bacterium]|nr:phosphoserine phosphatase SerB [Alphaproteobacteria bacterium]
MPTILTLIGTPGAIAPDLIARARHALGHIGIVTRSEVEWLSEGEACDITLPDVATRSTLPVVEQALGPAPVDVVFQKTEQRKKRLLVADMDSTIITCECIDELADAVGLKPQVAVITERTMRGEIEFESALTERVALLKGMPASELERIFNERVRLTSGAKPLVATMRKNGARCVLVSGGFTFFTSRVAALAGFDESQGNTLEVADGKLTGRVIPPILGRDAKLAALMHCAEKIGIPLEATLAAGDGANDLAMIKDAGLGVAFHAKPAVAIAADAAITYGDLTALLFIQGYKRTEFISG